MADNENRLESILSRFDADWTASDEARREAKNDLFFSRVSQWDDWLSQYTTLQYRGQFDVVRPVVRKLVSEMRQNPIDVLYRPKDGASPDAADVLMGMYRTDMRHNTAKIAVNVAVREQIESGVGAWRLVTDYEDQSPTSNNQVIRREPIHSACSHVIWDSNSKLMDKSDARHCTVIHSMSQNGWEGFAEKYDLDADDIPSFQNPNDWVFPWLTQDTIQIAEFYEVVEKKETAFIYQDPVTGEPVSYFKRDIKDVIDDLADSGFIKIAERQIKRRRVNGGQVAYDTVNQLNMRADLETYVFQDNLATAMRRDGEIYQSIVNDIYDVPRNVTITLEDGSEKEVQLMAEVVDLATGERQVLNDIRGRYECYTDVGPSFQSMKQQNRAEILELLGKTPQGTPEYQLLLLQYFTLLDGKGVEMMRDYANKQLIQMGVKKPETPEEQQWFVEAQQAKQGQQDPAMVQAQGVLLQGQAELAKAQNQTLSLQIDAAKVEAQNQLNAAKIAEIFNNMDLSKQSEFREFLKTVASFQQDRSEDARANAELLLKGNEQTHKQRMDIANILQSQRQNQPSGSVAETPQ